MAVFVYIDDDRPFPAEQEVAGTRPERHSDTQVHVVCHEDKHEEVADHHLYHVEHTL